MAEFLKNVPNWHPTRDDYRLVFRQVDGIWREISNNLPEYSGLTLAEYLAYMDILVDDRCTFMRLQDANATIEYRVYGGHITVDFRRLAKC